MYQKIYKSGYAVYLVLFVFAVVFYKERIIFGDAAFHLFFILKAGWFEIQASRFGTVLTQIGPVLTSMLHLPLSTVALSYSLNYFINCVVCYFLCGHVFKNYSYAIILLLCNTLIVSDSFYAIQSELLQAMPLVAAVLGYITVRKSIELNVASAVVLSAAMVTIALLHPLVMFMVLFAALFHMISNGTLGDKKLFIAAITLFFLAVMVRHFFLTGNYDQQAEQGVGYFITLFPNYFDTHSMDVFIQYCVDKYYWLPILTLAISVYYIVRKQWLKLIMFVGYTFGYLLLVNVSHPDGRMGEAYAEAMYMPLSFIIALPLVYDVLPAITKRNIAYAIVALITLLGVVRIYNTRVTYSGRLDWERQFMLAHHNEKILAPDNMLPNDITAEWATPYEFWLLSTIEHDTTASIYLSDSVGKYAEEARWDNKALLTAWYAVPYTDLPARYFKFRDTTTAYKILK